MVDDEEMSSQGSVNAPMAPPQVAVQHSPKVMAPTEVLGIPTGWNPVTTQQFGVAGPSVTPAQTVPMKPTYVVATPTMPVDAPTHAETKQAFDDMSSALCDVSSQHEMVHTSMQGLEMGVEELHCAHVGNVETTTQVQATP